MATHLPAIPRRLSPRRFAAGLASLAAVLLSALPAYSLTPEIRDIDVTLTLLPDGSAQVNERWDVCAASGTEWYLVRGNLGDISIEGLKVSDESGLSYVNEGEWDTERSIGEKAGRCGIVHKKGGAEICWGIGSLGNHVFDVQYTMTRAVKSLGDYDMLHLQTVSPGLSSAPEHVKVTVRAYEGAQLDTSNTRAWGFGYEGLVDFRDGEVVFESTEPFVRNSSVIVLLRFDKGVFNSPSVQDRSFSDVLAVAMEGADFGSGSDLGSGSGSGSGSGDGDFLIVLMTIIALVGGSGALTAYGRHLNRKKILGMKPSEVSWCRDIPFGGNLEASAYTLSKLGETSSTDNLAAALILRMIYNGELSVSKDSRERIEIHFGSKASVAGGAPAADAGGPLADVAGGSASALASGSVSGSVSGSGDSVGVRKGSAPTSAGSTAADGPTVAGGTPDPIAAGLRDMMLKASGSDRILQKKEFSRWASGHTHEVVGWTKRALVHGRDILRDSNMIYASDYTPAGQENARKLLGLKMFLKDFTLIGERDTIEVVLWQDYLVFGALFGIADKVAEQLKDINPEAFTEVMEYDYPTIHQMILQTRILSAAITNSKAAVASEGSGSRGLGGGASFGGGGGFSGGGFGGGSR